LENNQKGVDGRGDFDDSTCMRNTSTTFTGSETMAQSTEMTAIQHGEYQTRTRNMSDSELRFVIADCKAAMEAMPNGHKVGYYADEINYSCTELKRRQDAAA